jgi:acyl phosphate:glycerol-3-phosphate acyltransferase
MPVMLLLAFLCGSLPFSVWSGRLFLRRDVRQFGDGNPGAANTFRAGGNPVGLLVLVLDISKAAVPVGVAYFYLDYQGLDMFLIAVAPILGHAFSPFLGFKGGKAIAPAFGVWIGLTLWKVSLFALLLVIMWSLLVRPTGWAVMLTLGSLLVLLVIWMPDKLLLATVLGQALILGWTHRHDLSQKPRFHPRWNDGAHRA